MYFNFIKISNIFQNIGLAIGTRIVQTPSQIDPNSLCYWGIFFRRTVHAFGTRNKSDIYFTMKTLAYACTLQVYDYWLTKVDILSQKVTPLCIIEMLKHCCRNCLYWIWWVCLLKSLFCLLDVPVNLSETYSFCWSTHCKIHLI